MGTCRKFARLILLAMCASVGASHASATVPPQAQTRPLRAATARKAPFVLEQGDQLTGFSIDLWDTLARRLHADFSWVELKSSSELLQAVQRGDADVAIGAITMTPEREQVVDFSHPYFDSGLQIMARAQSDSSLLNTIQRHLSPAIGQFLGAAIITMFLLANVLWLVERRNNLHFQRGYVLGILEGLWGVILIIATGEHGDRDAPNWVKRITVASMWLLGVVLVAQFTATVTSSLTVQRLRSSLQGPGDLPGKVIGSVPGTTAAAYLSQLGLPYVEVTSVDQGFNLLMQGQVQAIVFDAPTLQYWAARRGNGVLQVVGPIFRPEKYGIAVAQGSPLRKQINEALLTLYEDGKYEEIYNKWFSQSR